ncbi:MAG: hypothetical protein H6742_20235 [Alphaproteobacteria bacterium]|nr:hypothetical protein [Alphaproteobacteria bacterium]
MRSQPLLLALPVLLLACEEQGSGITVGKQATAECALSKDSLVDTEWVILKAMPDKTEIPDHKTRMKFVKGDDGLQVKYNVGSLSDMYTYDCETKGEGLVCVEEPKVKDMCQALLVADAECTDAKLKELAPNASDDEIKKGIEEAVANVEKYKGGEGWDSFKLNNNNLGNKLQGILYVDIDTRNCRLRITDNYVTIYNGKRLEDSNPTGTNPFVKHEGGELLWEHCTDSGDVAITQLTEYPEDLTNVAVIREAGMGDEVHFWYLGDDGRQAAETCDVTYDLWFDGTNPQKGLKPEIVDAKGGKEYRWHWSHKWTEPNKDGTPLAGTTFIHRKWTCQDATKNGEEVSCAALVIR